MDPLAPPPEPGTDAGTADPRLRSILGLSAMPEQEQWLLDRLHLAQKLRYAEPHHVSSGAGPGIAWGLSDAMGQILGAHQEGKAQRGLEELSKQRVAGRQKFFDLANEDPTKGVPDMLRRPDSTAANALRKRSLASTATMTGDPVLEKAGTSMLHEQELERQYAALAQQIEHSNRQLKLQERAQGETEKQHQFERGHALRTEQDWATTPVPDLGGFTHTSKHTGESWLIIPGRPPMQISKGVAPGGAHPGMGGVAAPGGPSAAAGGEGVPSATGPVPPGPGGARTPYVKLPEGSQQNAVRVSSGATGLLDALQAGFPENSGVGSVKQALTWKAAEHGYPQLTGPDDQQRVAAWDAVFDPLARERAGLRIPEEQMARMRMELRPNPGESWDVHASKVKRILDTFRAAAANLPPIRSDPIHEELDKAEAMLPKTKAAYEAFNKNAVETMRRKRAGSGAPATPAASPPGSPLRKVGVRAPPPGAAPLQDRLKSYYGGP